NECFQLLAIGSGVCNGATDNPVENCTDDQSWNSVPEHVADVVEEFYATHCCCQVCGIGQRGEFVAEKCTRDDGSGDKGRDRKSTRLNSSHVSISYAVFCLKKKNINNV